MSALLDHLIEKPNTYWDGMAVFLFDEFDTFVTNQSISRALAAVGWSKKAARRVAICYSGVAKGAAASVIAVIQLSAKVASLCAQYYSAVRNAKSDIERLQGELGYLKATLEGARQLLESPSGERLRTSQHLRENLGGCSSRLTELETKLEKTLNPGGTRRYMRRFRLHTLKWPFESKDIDGIIRTLERYRDTFSAALQIDQAARILDISQKFVLSELPIAKDASFDSYAEAHESRCYLETRVAFRQTITNWAKDL
ncbi:hypothetical protein DL771_008195 [Monosporascus sp. 5C6A]|nr:hypothetical protein DL771_008195 [Monosporascus sp. 5C6A]